jgi:hypothetical protein
VVDREGDGRRLEEQRSAWVRKKKIFRWEELEEIISKLF